ncbi:hypothetical protein BLNAU_14814 [Blattamonas nauphoetae]|uniref:CUE domain-containing protein n=1 Tax=Blattamonas nauphoetae TaxID=2049346 RepID=A0ABQ9XJ72_9EUKA|nr:hypothetical protein BLNAU_14814 [Blattamonas nauphoetae]
MPPQNTYSVDKKSKKGKELSAKEHLKQLFPNIIASDLERFLEKANHDLSYAVELINKANVDGALEFETAGAKKPKPKRHSSPVSPRARDSHPTQRAISPVKNTKTTWTPSSSPQQVSNSLLPSPPVSSQPRQHVDGAPIHGGGGILPDPIRTQTNASPNRTNVSDPRSKDYTTDTSAMYHGGAKFERTTDHMTAVESQQNSRPASYSWSPTPASTATQAGQVGRSAMTAVNLGEERQRGEKRDNGKSDAFSYTPASRPDERQELERKKKREDEDIVFGGEQDDDNHAKQLRLYDQKKREERKRRAEPKQLPTQHSQSPPGLSNTVHTQPVHQQVPREHIQPLNQGPITISIDPPDLPLTEENFRRILRERNMLVTYIFNTINKASQQPPQAEPQIYSQMQPEQPPIQYSHPQFHPPNQVNPNPRLGTNGYHTSAWNQAAPQRK